MQLQVGVKVALKNSEGKILLLRRSEATYGKTDGTWDIPGGRIEPGSDLLTNLSRELREETGLVLASTPKLIAAQDIFASDERHVVRLTYTAHAEGEPVLDLSENTEYRWVPFDEFVAENGLDRCVRQLLSSGTLGMNSWT